MLPDLPRLSDPTVDLDVVPTADNLVGLADELCARSFSLCDGVATFTGGHGDDLERWQGHLGARGLVRLQPPSRT